MPKSNRNVKAILSLAFVLGTAALLIAGVFALANFNAQSVQAAPIPPPEGYPKFLTSVMEVNPALAGTGGAVLEYRIELRNTGAYRAPNTTFTNPFPAHTSYSGGATASSVAQPQVNGGVLTWNGTVPFDGMVVITYGLTVDAAFSGTLLNEGVISQANAPEDVTVSAEAVITDDAILEISKTSLPELPGPGQPLTYTISVTNIGQPDNLDLTVTDNVPANTTLVLPVPGGNASPNHRQVTWTSNGLSLGTGETATFEYIVQVNAVTSGTVITNDAYQVTAAGLGGGAVVGEPVTTTVVDPVISLYKRIDPDPPGSNGNAIYSLTVLNTGSRATDLTITDEVPEEMDYVSGGDDYHNGVVSWSLDSLGTRETATFTFTVAIPDIAAVGVLNDVYEVCYGVICVPGVPLTSVVQGPTFEVEAWVDPIAKGPGGGNKPVTPTLVLRNLGPGSALDANVNLFFDRISVSDQDLIADTPGGLVTSFQTRPKCGDKCVSYGWTGDLGAGEVVTFTTLEGQSTIGGEEGTHYTATLVVTDVLGTYTTEPISGTAIGRITHLANLIPNKNAPPTIGRGELMTYTFNIWNSGLSTDEPPYPTLTDTVPVSVSLVSISDDGVSTVTDGHTVVSWTLPAVSTGEILQRSYVVEVDDDLISGTLIVNDNYRTTWYELEDGLVLSNTGETVTTTVLETGLVDSLKLVSPTFAAPGPDVVLTYFLHIANTSGNPLNNVHVFDDLPWEHSTYQRDAVASQGNLSDDIVSLDWHGDIPPNDEAVITFTVKVDPFFEGVITNTATIDDDSLLEPVVLTALAYITNDPVLRVHKSASPDPVQVGDQLEYTIRVSNLAQMATNLVLTDVLPANTTYVPGSATAGGISVGEHLAWEFPVLNPDESQTFKFRVTAGATREIVNAIYGVTSAEGASATGVPVVTRTFGRSWRYFPMLFLNTGSQ
ncbi:MAG: hypothetical protein ACK2UW_22335 [Anaerolineales bacterium]|jgi:uncharacterized repeat protein (TIGR01451 family)